LWEYDADGTALMDAQRRRTWRMRVQKGMQAAAAVALGVGMLMLSGCSGNEPKPMAQPTPDQVRGHADRGFDNLKKEEKERGAESNMPR
jgi:hypothetical protein